MARRNEGILDILVLFPWWVSVIVSSVFYVFFTFAVPNIVFENPMIKMVIEAFSNIAWMLALILLLPAPISYIRQRKKAVLLEEQSDIKSIRALSWKELEILVGEAYRRQGYYVNENEGSGPDGGIDIRLRKNGEVHFVQCKQWRSQKVGVAVVREMFGVLSAERASTMIIVTSGYFTQEAKKFAIGKPIKLVEGEELVSMVKEVQTNSSSDPLIAHAQENNSHITQLPKCTRCGSELILRTAKKGPNAGGKFYGCASFPKCRYTQASAG